MRAVKPLLWRRRKTGPKARRPYGLGRILLFFLKAFVLIHVVYIGLTFSLILLYKFVDPPCTILMPYRALGYGWKLTKPIPLPLSEVPLYIRSMLIAVEDGKFYTHHGIDMEAFKRAREVNARLGKPLYGGSTLTMQVARTLFLVPEKSYIRKYFEVITALELELLLPKERILELYFGYAEWGKGIFGIEAASRHYYNKSPKALTRDQSARLVALLSSPIKYTPSTLHLSAILRERYAYLTRRFIAASSVSPDNAEKEEPPPGAIEPGTIETGASEPEMESDASIAADGLETEENTKDPVQDVDLSIDLSSELSTQPDQNPIE